MAMIKCTPKDIRRFWSKVAKTDNNDDCWEWKAGRTKNTGYGRFSHHSIGFRSHRIAWEITYGEIPDDLWVLHKCDNPPCCNPNHLFLGTPKDNSDDMVKKGRASNVQVMGKSNGNCKLTDEQVSYIRSRYAAGDISQEKLAKEIGISPTQIWNIVHNTQRRMSG